MASGHTFTIVPSEDSAVETIESALKDVFQNAVDEEDAPGSWQDFFDFRLKTQGDVIAVMRTDIRGMSARDAAEALTEQHPELVAGIIRVGVEDTHGSGSARTYRVDDEGGWEEEDRKRLRTSRVSSYVIEFDGYNPVVPYT